MLVEMIIRCCIAASYNHSKVPPITLDFDLSFYNVSIFTSQLPTGVYSAGTSAKPVHLDTAPSIHLVGLLSPSNQCLAHYP